MSNNDNIDTVVNSDGYDGHQPTRVCPNCKKRKPLSDFGFRNMGNGTVRNQSWCKECRGGY